MTSELLNDSKSNYQRTLFNQSHVRDINQCCQVYQHHKMLFLVYQHQKAATSPQSHQTYPKHVSRSQIPAGQEDMYILKSEIVLLF